MSPSVSDGLAGLRILVVEDEMFVAMLVEDLLRDLGCDVVGPASNVADALKLAAGEQIDGAVLDVNLGGERVFAVADSLRSSAVPFVFVTGYGRSALTAAYDQHPMIQKPFEPRSFGATLAAKLALAADG
jgi:CheY-like chemotaxis protein